METDAINKNNKSSENNKSNNSEALKKGAAFAGAAVLGAGAAVAAEMIIEPEPVGPVVDPDKLTEETPEDTANTNNTEQQASGHASTGHGTASTTQTSTGATASQQTANQETTTTTTGQGGTTTPDGPAPQTGGGGQNNPGGSTGSGDVDNVDPNDIAQQIVEGDYIDPTDIDMPEVLDIAEVQTITTIDGQEVSAAVMYASDGSEIYMVDVDHDNQFDQIQSAEGQVIEDFNGTLTVSDAEVMISEAEGETGYLASSETDTFEAGLDTEIQQDIIDIV
ncbi:MAG: hypothetical protein ACI3YQ_03415 [Prevotella sp.]|nr:hypothetical protein [Prevotella sp.]